VPCPSTQQTNLLAYQNTIPLMQVIPRQLIQKIAKVNPTSQIFIKLGKMNDLLLLITEN